MLSMERSLCWVSSVCTLSIIDIEAHVNFTLRNLQAINYGCLP